MTYARYEHRHLTVACDLGDTDTKTRLGHWQALRDTHQLGAEAIPDGARLWLRADAASIAEDLVQEEAQCCGFLDFELATDGDRIRLDITSFAPQGAQIAAFLLGLNPDLRSHVANR